MTELARWGKGRISDVAFSADGKTLVVISSLGIFLHDARSLAETAFIPLEGTVGPFAISPDGRMMAGVIVERDCSCSRDVSVKLWPINDPAASREIPQYGEHIDGLAFSSDGATLLLVDERGVSIWRVRDMERLLFLEGKNYRAIDTVPTSSSFVVGVEDGLQFIAYDGQPLRDIRLSDVHGWESMTNIAHGGQTVASIVVEGGDVRIWNLPDGDPLQTETLGSGYVAVSPDGTRVAAGYADGWVRLYDARDGKLIRTLKGHDIGKVWGVFSPDNTTLVTASQDGVIRLWGASDGEFLQSLPGHANPAPVPPVVFNQEVLASASERTIQIRQMSDGSIQQMFEVPAKGNPRRNFEGPVGRVINLALSPDGSTLASGMDDGLIHLWQVADGSFIKTLDNECSLWGRMVFLPDGLRLAAEGYGFGCHTVSVLQIDKGASVFADDGAGLAVSLDGSKIAYVNKGIEVRDGVTGKPFSSFDSVRWGVEKDLVFAPDNQTLLSINESGFADLWQADNGKHLGTLEPNLSGVRGVAFSSDGQLLAAISSVGQIGLWRTSDWTRLNLFEDYIHSESSLIFSPEGRLVITTSQDGMMRFWQVADGALLYAIPDVEANQLTFVRNDLLMTAGFDGTIRLWGIPSHQR